MHTCKYTHILHINITSAKTPNQHIYTYMYTSVYIYTRTQRTHIYASIHVVHTSVTNARKPKPTY